METKIWSTLNILRYKRQWSLRRLLHIKNDSEVLLVPENEITGKANLMQPVLK